MNRGAFYAALRRRESGVFGTSLSQGQVNGCETLLNAAIADGVPLNRAAYCLATAYHETARTMQPIHERGGRVYFSKYEPGTRIGRMLGNTLPGDGYRFRGRGYVQLTGRRNYVLASKKLNVDFAADPDRALEPVLASHILFAGMAEGWFTGRDLSDFIDTFDESDAEDLKEYVNARRIVNGTDKAQMIGQYALVFEHALRDAGYEQAAQKATDAPKPRPATHRPDAPKNARTPSKMAGTGIAAIVAFLLATVWAWGGHIINWLERMF